MYETKHQITQRKIRNGLRKQKAMMQEQRQKELWAALKGEYPKKVGYRGQTDSDAGYYYCPYIPLMTVRQEHNMIMDLETTA